MRVIELKKAFCNKGFIAGLSIGLLLMICGTYTIMGYINSYFLNIAPMDKAYREVEEVSFLQAWMGGDPFTVFTNTFYLILFPLIAALPFASSGLKEKLLGYDKMVITKAGRNQYLNAKFEAVFLSGGVVVSVPSVLSLMFAMTRFPLIPETASNYQTGVNANSLWADIFYHQPLRYALMYIALDFIAGGALACLTLSLAYYVKSTFKLMTLPLLAGLVSVELFMYLPGDMHKISFLLPYWYVDPVSNADLPWVAVAVSIILITLISRLFWCYVGKKRDCI